MSDACPHCEGKLTEVKAGGQKTGYTCYDCGILWYGVTGMDVRFCHPETVRMNRSVKADGGGVSAEGGPDEIDRNQFTEDMAEAINAVRESHEVSDGQAARCVASLEFQTDDGWTSLRSVIANE